MTTTVTSLFGLVLFSQGAHFGPKHCLHMAKINDTGALWAYSCDIWLFFCFCIFLFIFSQSKSTSGGQALPSTASSQPMMTKFSNLIYSCLFMSPILSRSRKYINQNWYLDGLSRIDYNSITTTNCEIIA